MAFPVGNIPGLPYLALLQQQGFFAQSLAFVGGAGDVDLTNPATTTMGYCTRFLCTTAGTFIAQLAGDAVGTNQTYTLAVNDLLPGVFVLVKSASGCSGLLLK